MVCRTRRPEIDIRPRVRGGAARAPDGSDPPLLLRDVVDEEVLAEPVGPGIEGPPLVDARHALDERPEARAVVEHEGVDDDPPAGDALDLFQGLLGGPHADPAEGERPLAVETPAQEV